MKSKQLRCHGYRLSPNEEARILQEETEKLRKLRLVQVRELSKHNAALIRQSVQTEKQKQLQKLAQKVKKELDDVQEEKLRHLEARYDNCVRTIGTGHKEAGQKEDLTDARTSAANENAKIAGIRFREALEVFKEEQAQKDSEANYPILSRKLALEVEKERASQIASLPRPPPDPTLELGKQKHKPVRMTDSSAFSLTHYHMPQDIAVERANPHEQLDARDSAKEEAERIEHEQARVERSVQECQERARVRHNIAREKELLRLDYNHMLHDLSDLQRADIYRRQRQVHHIPKQVFQPPHRCIEDRLEKQQTMEQAFEDMYLKETDFTGDVSLALDPHAAMDSPVATDELELSAMSDRGPINQSDEPNHTQPLPPLQKSDILKDVTNIAKDQTVQSPQKSVLKKLFSQIKNQRDDWVARSSQDSPDLTSVSPELQRNGVESKQITPEKVFRGVDPVKDSPEKMTRSTRDDFRPTSPYLDDIGSPTPAGLSLPVPDPNGQHLSLTVVQTAPVATDSHAGKVEEAIRELKEIQEKKERLEEKLREYSVLPRSVNVGTEQLHVVGQFDVQKATNSMLNKDLYQKTESRVSMPGNLRPQKLSPPRPEDPVYNHMGSTEVDGLRSEAGQLQQDLRFLLSDSVRRQMPSATGLSHGITLAASDAIERCLGVADLSLSDSTQQPELRSDTEATGQRPLGSQSADQVHRIRDYQQKLLDRHQSWKMLAETRNQIERRRNELKHQYPQLTLPQMTSLPSSSTYLPSYPAKSTSDPQHSGAGLTASVPLSRFPSGLSGPVSTLASVAGYSVSDTLLQSAQPYALTGSDQSGLDNKRSVSLGHVPSSLTVPAQPLPPSTAQTKANQSDNIRKQLLFDSETPASSPQKQNLVSPKTSETNINRHIVSPVRVDSYSSMLLRSNTSKLTGPETTDIPAAIPLGQSRTRRGIHTSPDSAPSNCSINRSVDDQISALTSAAQERKQYFDKRQQQLAQQLENIQDQKAQCLQQHERTQQQLREHRQNLLQNLIQGVPAQDLLKSAELDNLRTALSQESVLSTGADKVGGRTVSLREQVSEDDLPDTSLRSDNSQGKRSWADLLRETSLNEDQTDPSLAVIDVSADEPHHLSTILEVDTPPQTRSHGGIIDRDARTMFSNRHKETQSLGTSRISAKQPTDGQSWMLRESREESERDINTDIGPSYEPVLSGLTIRRAADHTASPSGNTLTSVDQQVTLVESGLAESGSDQISAISGSQSKNSTESSLWLAQISNELSSKNIIIDPGSVRDKSSEAWCSADLPCQTSPLGSELTQYSTESGLTKYSGELTKSGLTQYSGELTKSGITQYSGELTKSGLTQYSGELMKSGITQYSGELTKSGLTQYSGSPNSRELDSSQPPKHFNLLTSRSFERLDPEIERRVAWKSDRDRVSPAGFSDLTQYTDSSLPSQNFSYGSHQPETSGGPIWRNDTSDWELKQNQSRTSLPKSRHRLTENSVTDARMLLRSNESGALIRPQSANSLSGSELTQYSNSPTVSENSGVHEAKPTSGSVSVEDKEAVNRYPLGGYPDNAADENKSSEFLLSGNELRRYNSLTERRAVTSKENIAAESSSDTRLHSEESYWRREPNTINAEPSLTNASFTQVSYKSDFSDSYGNNYNALKESSLSLKDNASLRHSSAVNGSTTSNKESDIFRAVKVFIGPPEDQVSPVTEKQGLTRHSIGTDERSGQSESSSYMTLPTVNRYSMLSRSDISNNFRGELSDKGDHPFVIDDFDHNRWIEPGEQLNINNSARSDGITWKELQLGSPEKFDVDNEFGIMDEPDLTLVSIATVNSPSKSYDDSQSESLVSFEKHEDSVDYSSDQTPRRLMADTDVILYLDKEKSPSKPKSQSLQEAFLSRKRDFHKSSDKQMEKAKQESCGSQPVSDLNKKVAAWKQSRGIRAHVASKGSPRKTHLSHQTKATPERKKEEKDKKDRTKRLYNQLEEVKEKNTLDERQKEYAANRVKAKQYHQKMHEKLKKQRSAKKL